MIGTLYLVATPIGNLSDFSSRAVETLRNVDLIACEDTRHTRKLLTHFNISKKLVSYHEHNETARTTEFAELLADGKNIAVVSDAGTPGISDPSFRIVEKAYEINARVVAIPGAVAFVNAVVISGIPTDSIFFGGFLPSRKNERQRRLEELREIPATLCFYESPHRLRKSLADCAEVLGNRKAAVARELTKIHEEIVRGKLNELANVFAQIPVKGEIVLIIDRENEENRHSQQSNGGRSLPERVEELEGEGLDNRAALKKAAKEFGISRSEAYRLMVNSKKVIQ